MFLNSWNREVPANMHLAPRHPPPPPRHQSYQPFPALPPVPPSSIRPVALKPGSAMYRVAQPDQTYAIPGGDFAPVPAMAWQLPSNMASSMYAQVGGFGYAAQAVAPNQVHALSPLASTSTMPQLANNSSAFGMNEAMLPVAPVMAATPPVDTFNPNAEPPFIDPNRLAAPRNHGVIKIKNIPYGITMAEVHQFAAKLVSEQHLVRMHTDGFPIHILMERSTGETMDVFIEVMSPAIAEDALERNFRSMRFPKLGQRHVTLELASQAQLMQELFPRTRCIVWDEKNAGNPVLVPNTDDYSAGFKSFLTDEELNGMTRHAETPQRSPFASRSCQRTFECMISTLYKYPWYADDLYTMRDRDEIWKTYVRQLEVLVFKCSPGMISSDRREVGLEYKLLLDLIFAGMNCPGFSERQKANFLEISRGAGSGLTLSRFASQWPFQTLRPHPANVSEADLDHWLRIFHLGVGAVLRETSADTPVALLPYIYVEWDNQGNSVIQATSEGAQLTRRQFAHIEHHFVKKLIRKGWVEWLGNAIDVGEDLDDLESEALLPLTSTIPGDATESIYSVARSIPQTSSTITVNKLTDGLAKVDIGEPLGNAFHQQLPDNLTTNLGSGLALNALNLSAKADTDDSSLEWSIINNPSETDRTKAFSGQGLGNGTIASPQRISTARRASVTTATPIRDIHDHGSISKLAGLFVGTGRVTASAPASAIRRENRALVICKPDGTPIDLPAGTTSSDSDEPSSARGKSSFGSAAGASDPFSSGNVSPLTAVGQGDLANKRMSTYSLGGLSGSRQSSLNEMMTPTWSARGSETGSPLRRRSSGLGHIGTPSLGRSLGHDRSGSIPDRGSFSSNAAATSLGVLSRNNSGTGTLVRSNSQIVDYNMLRDRNQTAPAIRSLHRNSLSFEDGLGFANSSQNISPVRNVNNVMSMPSAVVTPSSAGRGISASLNGVRGTPLSHGSPIKTPLYGIGSNSPFIGNIWKGSPALKDGRVGGGGRPDTITETSEDDVFADRLN